MSFKKYLQIELSVLVFYTALISTSPLIGESSWIEGEQTHQKGVASRISGAVSPLRLPDEPGGEPAPDRNELLQSVVEIPGSMEAPFHLEQAEEFLRRGALKEGVNLLLTLSRMSYFHPDPSPALSEIGNRSRDRLQQLKGASTAVRNYLEEVGITPFYLTESDRTILFDPENGISLSLKGAWRTTSGPRTESGTREVYYARSPDGESTLTLERETLQTGTPLTPLNFLEAMDTRRSLSRQRKLVLGFERSPAPGTIPCPGDALLDRSGFNECGIYTVEVDSGRGRIQYVEFAGVKQNRGVRLELRKRGEQRASTGEMRDLIQGLVVKVLPGIT